MASFFKNSKLAIPKSFFFSTQAQKHSPPFPSFKAAKSAIISEKNPEKLAEIFQQCSHLPTFLRHRPIYHLSIRKLARANRLDLVDRLLQTQKLHSENAPALKSEGFWIRLIMLYSNAGMVPQALQTLEDLCQNRYSNVSEKSLCAILTVYLNNGMFEQIHDCFKSIPVKLGVKPTVVSHNLILKAFVKENKLEPAREWVEKMDVSTNIDTYNILLSAYLKNGDDNGFDGVMKEVLKKGLEGNLTTYNHRISRLCKSKECARAKKLLDEMVSKGVKPNSASYNTIIDGFCRIGDLESARKVLDKMLSDGFVLPCSFTYYTLIRSMVREGEFDSALEMSMEIIKRKWVPPFEAMEGLVKGLVERSRSEEAKRVVEKMKKRLKGDALESWGKIEAALPL
ncbi:pentatricopeptide repeat-containing protein At1g61870, mitochondrial-like [Durio zibethinus]|uniref:Pentatricopeptide repeat-containing protein At1g61870, mitochondrial-like n=1 Tax=Durio zibethinus TaxID=66656 RepID=A0A6P6BHM7_DURZI|nr:pentatricopeptide repeat-containing protein At1g61870, mitochondrial-like [Durio zibethinus]